MRLHLIGRNRRRGRPYPHTEKNLLRPARYTPRAAGRAKANNGITETGARQNPTSLTKTQIEAGHSPLVVGKKVKAVRKTLNCTN